MPDTPKGFRLPNANDVPHHDGGDFQANGHFARTVFRRYERS